MRVCACVSTIARVCVCACVYVRACARACVDFEVGSQALALVDAHLIAERWGGHGSSSIRLCRCTFYQASMVGRCRCCNCNWLDLPMRCRRVLPAGLCEAEIHRSTCGTYHEVLSRCNMLPWGIKSHPFALVDSSPHLFKHSANSGRRDA